MTLAVIGALALGILAAALVKLAGDSGPAPAPRTMIVTSAPPAASAPASTLPATSSTPATARPGASTPAAGASSSTPASTPTSGTPATTTPSTTGSHKPAKPKGLLSK
jgi:hypothetical protein